MNIELLKVGCLVMIIGMGFVFFFLFIMIGIMNATSKLLEIFNKYFPEEIEETPTVSGRKSSANNDAEIALAIACAALKSRKV